MKFHHAVNPKPVPKIPNLQMRMSAYRVELQRFVMEEFAISVVVAACVVFPAVYFSPDIFELLVPQAPVQALPPYWWWARWALATFWWIAISAVYFVSLKPRRPMQEDVLADVALRHQVGMDDSVAE